MLCMLGTGISVSVPNLLYVCLVLVVKMTYTKCMAEVECSAGSKF